MRPKNFGEWSKEEKLEYYRRENKHSKPGQILCAGSSLMEQFPIEKFIEEAGEPITVYNRGIGGYVTEELLAAIDVCILDLKPSRMFINIGTNDLSNPDRSLEAVMHTYGEILSRTEKMLPQTEIYLMAYYPINYEAAAPEMKPCLKIRTNEKINQANELVKKLAKEHDARYIDLNAPLKDERGNLKAEYTIEGMHIKEEGYRMIYDAFMKYATEPSWK